MGVRGPNPLEYVGIRFSDTGKTATIYEVKNRKWVKYNKIDGTASYRVNAPQKWRGNFYSIDKLYSTYDWVTNNGYENFASWVK